MTEAQIHLPQKLVDTLGPPRGSYQYRVLRGGRGSGKSVGAATIALVWGYAEPIRVLCVRQFQNSIRDSFYTELTTALELYPWLADHYIVTKESITGRNGTVFIFKGLDRNPQSIKSLAKIDLTIVEEAEDIPEASWINLEATIFRQPKSELWCIYNPRKENSPVDFRFVKNKAPRSIVTDVQYLDNPFFPKGLDTLRQRDLEVFDYSTYAHIWLGAYLKNSKAQVFHDKFEVKEFDADATFNGPYQGLDWGYSQDPTAAIRCWIKDECLWIDYEAGGVGIELDDVPSRCQEIPDFAKYVVRADSAQPAMISHVRQRGLPKIEGAKKGKGSVEDGIQFIRSFRKIYVHPRCRNVINELGTYSWKVDRLSGDILTEPVDAFNHYCIAEGQGVLTSKGIVAIENVKAGDMVMTRKGWKRVLVAQVTGYDKPIIEVTTTIGKLVCTPDHPVFANGVFTRADALRYGDDVLGDASWQRLQNGADTLGEGGQTQGNDLTGFTFSAASRAASYICTGKFGRAFTGIYQKVTTSTTLTKTPETTQSKTLNAYLPKIMHQSIRSVQNVLNCNLGTLPMSTIWQGLGIQRLRGLKSIAASAQWLMQTLCLKKRIAKTATSHSCLKRLAIVTDFAATLANQISAESQALMMKSGRANGAMVNSLSVNTVKHEPVAGLVLTVKCIGTAKRVYNLSVEECPEFIAGGILTHNCDALRYALEPVMLKQRFSYSGWV